MTPVWLLALVQLWESFSFFGMRALLVLFLVSELHVQENQALSLYAFYIALVELVGVGGSYLADRIIGLRPSIFLGSCFIMMGHLSLLLSHDALYLGLGLIIAGSSFFRSSVKALLGLSCDNVTKESGFTLLYTGMNLGGFAAAVLCGIVAKYYGFQMGLSLAAFGMFLGMILLISQRDLLTRDVEKKKVSSLFWITPVAILGSLLFAFCVKEHKVFTPYLLFAALGFFFLVYRSIKESPPKKEFFGLMTALIVYFACEELICSLLALFCEQRVNRELLGFTIPTPALLAVNPLAILLMSPLFYRMSLAISLRLILSFFLLSISFLLLYTSTFFSEISLFIPIVSFSLIALGEFILVPGIFSFCSNLVPKTMQARQMSLIAIAFGIANILSGQMSQQGIGQESSFLFLAIGVIALLISGTTLLLRKRGRWAVPL